MSVLRISYPVTEGAKTAIAKYPAIGRVFRLPGVGRSEYEIVRLLSNTHYDHIGRLLEFTDKWLDSSGPIGRKILKVKHPFELEQAGAELAIFAHLYERLGTAVQALASDGAPMCPDIEVRFESLTVRIEVYTPVDLMGFQLFERYIPMVLKYLDASRGYHLDLETQPVQECPGYDQETLYYPYTIPDEPEMHGWLVEFSKHARQWMSKKSPEDEFHMPGPGGKVQVIVKIVELSDDPGDRLVCSHWATRSTDTKLFFEVGTAEDTARSQWGRKLSGKLRKQQCGPKADGVLRMLIVNFALADTGWPHFISEERFTNRFRDTIELLDDGKQLYDIVLPAQLGFRCRFGQPVWICGDSRECGARFIGTAGLDRQCEPPPDPTEDEIEELLSSSTPGQNNVY